MKKCGIHDHNRMADSQEFIYKNEKKDIKKQNVEHFQEQLMEMIAVFVVADRGRSEMLKKIIELPMYEAVMNLTFGNQVRAAKILGIARGTLRHKLVEYFGTTNVGGRYYLHTQKKEANSE